MARGDVVVGESAVVLLAGTASSVAIVTFPIDIVAFTVLLCVIGFGNQAIQLTR